MDSIHIRCPKCEWEPDGKPYWRCSCGTRWDTFSTGGRCPTCQKVWEDTQCPNKPGGCRQWSPHLDWYEHLDGVVEEVTEVLAEPIVASTLALSNFPARSITLGLVMLSLFLIVQTNGQLPASLIVVDTTITGFSYVADLNGTAVYRARDPLKLPASQHPSTFSVSRLPNSTLDDAKRILRYLMHSSSENGNQVSDQVEKDTMITGHAVFYLSYTETKEHTNYRNLVFNAAFQTAMGVVLFSADDLENGKFMDRFRKTFYTLVL